MIQVAILEYAGTVTNRLGWSNVMVSQPLDGGAQVFVALQSVA